MLEVSLYCIGRTPHLSMPVTGLLMLQEQGKLRLSWEIDQGNRKGFPYLPLLGAYAEGKRILFDMADGYGMPPEELAQAVRQSDVYFRRSFSQERNHALGPVLQGKMRPFGFHYHVSWPGNFMDKAVLPQDLKNELFQFVFNGASRRYFTPDKFECEPRKTDSPTVMFYTRLWDPGEIPALHDSLVVLNENRIRLVAELKKRYGPRFIGGIQYSRFAVRNCRELVTGVGMTKRRNYLRAMQQADICVGTTGLHDSIGWKTAEYIAASKAVVNEKFHYEVTGDFREGVNCLLFTEVEECIDQVARLMSDPERVYAMGQANRAYYQAYLRPDRIMANALRQVFPDFDEG